MSPSLAAASGFLSLMAVSGLQASGKKELNNSKSISLLYHKD
jgi:hypothetical protein